MSQSSKHRVGIVGANWTLKVHGTAWRMFQGVEVGAVCTAHRETAEAAARAFDIPKAYWSIEDMMADGDLTIIDVGTKPSLRYDMVLAALKAGKHVYNCLPFATSLERAQSQLSAQRHAGVVGVVDSQFRWTPAGQKMKRMVEEGFLGRPLGFSVQLVLPLVNNGAGCVYPYAAWPEGGVTPYRWMAEKDSGGSAWRAFGSHALLFLTHLLGPVQRVCGATQLGVPDWRLPDGSVLRSETVDHACALLQLGNGALGTLQTGWAQPGAQYLRVEVWGDRGRLLLEDPTFGDGLSARLFQSDASHAASRAITPSPVGLSDDLYRVAGTSFNRDSAPSYMVPMCHLFADMLESIEQKREGSPSFAEATHVQGVVEAMLHSEQMEWPIVA